MKRQACRLRLLLHLPALPKSVTDRAAATRLTKRRRSCTVHLPGGNRVYRRPDSKLLSRLCFRKGKLGEEELEMLFNARAEWDEFDRVFPLAEEFVKIIRGRDSMTIGL